MPRTALDVQGEACDLAFTAGDVDDGNDFEATGAEVLIVHNAGGSARTLTLASSPDYLNRLGDITDYSVGAGEFAIFPQPLTRHGWRQSDGRFHLDVAHADLELAVYRPPLDVGDFIVTYPEPPDLDPLLAEAVLLLRASQWPGSGDWLNEGTAGSALDAAPTGAIGEGEVIDPVTAAPAIRLTGGGTFDFAYDAVMAVGASDSFTAMIWHAPLVDESIPVGASYFSQASITTQTGWGLGDGSAFAPATGYQCLLNDGDFNPVSPGVPSPTAGVTILTVARLDRNADEASLFIDGSATVADMTGLGGFTNENGGYVRGVTGAGQDVLAAAWWDRALTDTEITVDLPAALGV